MVHRRHTRRVGAPVTFPAGRPRLPLRLEDPAARRQVVGEPTGRQPQFAQDRAANAAPQDVGGDIQLATFNVLNYFPTTGEEFVASGLGTCTFFNDRDGNPIAINSCNPNGPRGAANTENLERQQSKIVTAINRLDADIVSLEELENSAQVRQATVTSRSPRWSTALNADAGAGTWAFAPSPPEADRPPVAERGRDPDRLHLQAGRRRARSAARGSWSDEASLRQRA